MVLPLVLCVRQSMISASWGSCLLHQEHYQTSGAVIPDQFTDVKSLLTMNGCSPTLCGHRASVREAVIQSQDDKKPMTCFDLQKSYALNARAMTRLCIYATHELSRLSQVW